MPFLYNDYDYNVFKGYGVRNHHLYENVAKQIIFISLYF